MAKIKKIKKKFKNRQNWTNKMVKNKKLKKWTFFMQLDKVAKLKEN